MKATIDGKRYDSDKCEVLGEIDHYTAGSNNYCGTSYLLRASDGTYLYYTDANGQSCHCVDGLSKVGFPNIQMADIIDRLDITDEQEARLQELGLIEIVK